MEVPDLEELQWLEANSNVEVEEEDYSVQLEDDYERDYGKDEDDSYNQFQFQAPTTQPTGDGRADNKKRPRGLNSEASSSTTTLMPDSDDDSNVRVRVRIQSDEPTPIYLSRYASEIDGDCMPVTAPSASGERVYAMIDKHIFSPKSAHATSANPVGLISEPVNILLQKAEQDAVLKALQASSETQNNFPESPSLTEELWVNKYAPKSFTELLSDENTNREVLIWLKQWDHTVFGTDIRNTEEEVLSALRRHSSIPHHKKHIDTAFMRKNSGSMASGNYGGHLTALNLDDIKSKGPQGFQNKRLKGSITPDEKVLLLCGPPGLGKTTLAHVVAKHCGYHVVEINASDDRSSTIIETKILDAVQMNSVMADSKPKCLVIDEIDGALGEGKGAVEIIVKMVAAEKKTSLGRETYAIEGLSGHSSRKKERKAACLSRPVICICNDLYAPSLRPLRRIAKVHMFAQPSVSRVVSRLKYICDKEGVKTSSIALTALAEYTECDIRSCLNTLQFLQTKKESLNLDTLNCQVIGRKDMTRSLFDIWKEVFQKQKTKKTPKHDASQMNTYDTHNSLYNMVSFRGDHELIADGIHENFLRLHYHDPMLHKTVDCLDALGVSDLLHQCFMRSHNTSLYAYHPSITVRIHSLLAHVERPVIEWPKSFHRHRLLLMEKMEILRSWQSKIPPYISRHLSVHSFIEDTVSPLLFILSPADSRPVAMHLLSEKVKSDLAQLVSTMVLYSLTYKSTRSDPSTNISTHDRMIDASSLSFDPPIHDFVSFKDIKPGHCELKSAVKQIIMHEVERQNIMHKSTPKFMNDIESIDNSRKENIVVSSKETGMPVSSKVHDAACVGFNRGNKNMSKVICESSIQSSSCSLGSGGHSDVKGNCNKHKMKPSISSFNFFDRFRNSSSKEVQNVDNSAKKATEERDGRPLLFKFNEGFTNAVKKPVRLREFLR